MRGHSLFRVLLGSSLVLFLAALANANHTYYVSSSTDSNSTPPYTSNTLRWAIYQVNTNSLNSDPDYISINATSPSNTITVNGSIGGLVLTKKCTIAAHPNNGVVIMGNNCAYGLILNPGSDGTLLTNLCFINFKKYNGTGAGLQIQSNNNQIWGGRYGTNWWDQSGHGNDHGIYITGGCTGNIITDYSPGTSNYDPIVISGNLGNGVWTDNTDHLTVKSAYIGLASDGLTALPNAGYGVLLEDFGYPYTYITPQAGATYCTIGGDYTTDRNVISGNGLSGVMLRNNNPYASGVPVTSHNSVIGNIIGLNKDLNGAVPNQGCGVAIGDGICNNTIGDGSFINYNNIIGGNLGQGILLRLCSGNVVQNNQVGLVGSAPFPNAQGGIWLYGSQSCLIGGVRSSGRFDGNVISGNNPSFFGIQLANDANGNTVSANVVGLDTTGTSLLPSQGNNIYLLKGSHNLIGGQNTAGSFRGNVVAGCNVNIQLTEGNGNTVSGNYVGLEYTGNAALNNNSTSGIFASNLAANTLIGGPDSTWGNVVSGMGQGSVSSAYGIVVYMLTDCVITGNRIGTSANGMTVIPNNSGGILLAYSASRVGGLTPGERNQICGSTDGIVVEDGAANGMGNSIVGNCINVLADNTLDPSHLLASGVIFDKQITGAQGNLVGYKNNPASGNLIAGTTYNIEVNNGCVNNGFFSNTLCAVNSVVSAYSTIYLMTGGSPSGNYGKAAPVITSAVSTVSGTSGNNDYIEVFLSDPNPAYWPGSLRLLGSGTANGTGHWTVSVSGVSAGQFITALATDANNNTSQFSGNFLYGPPYTMTVTPTPTLTSTPTVTATATISPTRTASPTQTNSPTTSPTPSASPSITVTATISQTTTISPTATTTPTTSPTATISPSPTVTATPSTTSVQSGIDLGGHAVLAYPNPGHGVMHFILKLDQTSDVKVVIYNMAGEKVAALAGTLAGPVGSLTWDCAQVGGGIYIARIYKNNSELAKLKVAVVK